jgi:hypothetical protein
VIAPRAQRDRVTGGRTEGSGASPSWRSASGATTIKTVTTTAYRLQLASDVSVRDGMGLELLSADGIRIAEVFQDDDTGLRTVSIFGDRELPLADLEWFLAEARVKL